MLLLQYEAEQLDFELATCNKNVLIHIVMLVSEGTCAPKKPPGEDSSFGLYDSFFLLCLFFPSLLFFGLVTRSVVTQQDSLGGFKCTCIPFYIVEIAKLRRCKVNSLLSRNLHVDERWRGVEV